MTSTTSDLSVLSPEREPRLRMIKVLAARLPSESRVTPFAGLLELPGMGIPVAIRTRPKRNPRVPNRDPLDPGPPVT